MKRNFLRLFGIISLVCGLIGIALPLLPTTPFLLLSSFLFVRSSKKLHSWLINHRILGQYIKDFQEDKAIPLKVKISSISLLWITILISAFVFVDNNWVRLLLICIAIGVTVHILQYKTKKRK